jgi:hypothetical protein
LSNAQRATRNNWSSNATNQGQQSKQEGYLLGELGALDELIFIVASHDGDRQEMSLQVGLSGFAELIARDTYLH